MPFCKFSEIEHSYRENELKYFLDMFPELKDIELPFIVWEKIDGANIQFFMEPEYKEFRVASRNQPVDRRSGFNGVWDVLAQDDFKKFMEVFEEYSRSYGYKLNLYGEIYGSRIQCRIDYGATNIKFYAMKVDNVYLTPQKFIENFEMFGFPHLVSPYNLVSNLQACLDYDVETPISLLCPPDSKRNHIEGVVFHPYTKNFFAPSGDRFIFKKKSKRFGESKSFKIRKDTNNLSDIAVELNKQFRTYINENRALSAFSKEGRKIEKLSEIGFWVKVIMEDAKKDFMKDYAEDLETVPNTERKSIFFIGSSLADILKKFVTKN